MFSMLTAFHCFIVLFLYPGRLLFIVTTGYLPQGIGPYGQVLNSTLPVPQGWMNAEGGTTLLERELRPYHFLHNRQRKKGVLHL